MYALTVPVCSATTTFKLNVTTSSGSLQIPVVASSITLNGRQSKVIVTNYGFGQSSNVVYSTAQIFFAGVIDGRDVLFLFGDSSQEHEAVLVLTGTPSNQRQQAPASISFTQGQGTTDNQGTIVNFLAGSDGLVTVWDSDTQLVLFADTETAATFWSPVIAGPASDPLRNFWGLGTNTSILVGGPYLVRDASISGSHLALRGDLNTSVRLTVIAPRAVTSVSWNGDSVSGDAAASSALTSTGGFVGQLTGSAAAAGVVVPTLGGWKFKDSLPEVAGGFDDSSWVVANKTKTNIPFLMYYGDGRVLYGCDYGL